MLTTKPISSHWPALAFVWLLTLTLGCLFDLKADPRETQDLAEARPEQVVALSAVIEAAKALDAGTEAPEIETQLSPEAVEKLRSLGYLD